MNSLEVWEFVGPIESFMDAEFAEEAAAFFLFQAVAACRMDRCLVNKIAGFPRPDPF
jgi:hypothetical protein